MKTPDAESARKCLDIRKRSKRGEYVARPDLRFCERMLRTYPEWYQSTEVQVFNETLPFGSEARK